MQAEALDVAGHVDHLEREGAALAAAAEQAGLDARVPSCPDWAVRDLLIHTGGVHRWAADIVATRSQTHDTAAGDAVGTGPGDAELLDWFRDGHAALVATLRAAPPDLDCFTFLPAPSPLAFWARRQAHETTIHRVDAEAAAAGAITPVDPALASSGIEEMLTGFARRRSNAIATPGRIALRASDAPSWLITLGGERVEAQIADGEPADVTVDGSASDVYYWLWNRPSAARVSGNADIAAAWRTIRVRWS